MRGQITFLVLSLNLLTLSACQQEKQLAEMHDTTAEMRDITRDMRDNTQQMNVSTKGMNGDMGKMQQSLQQTLVEMQQMVTLMTQLIGNTGEMNKTTQTMNGNLVDMKKSMDEMHANTQVLVDRMDHLAKVTESNLVQTNGHMVTMTSTMRNMEKTTNGLCQSRHAVTAERRDDAFKKMTQADTIEHKVKFAAEYEMAFEFQMWGICGDDTPASRDAMISTAMNELTLDLVEVTNSNAQANPLSSLIPLLPSARQDDNYNSIAAALHKIDEPQLQNLARYNANHAQKIQPASMLTLIAEALQMPQPKTEWQHIVWANRPAMIRLLQARQNIMQAIVMDTLVKTAKNQSWGATWMTRLNVILGTQASWSVNIDGFTDDEIKTFTGYLGFALQTRQLLTQKLKEPIYRDSKLNALVQSVNLVSAAEGPKALQVSRARFKGFLNLLK